MGGAGVIAGVRAGRARAHGLPLRVRGGTGFLPVVAGLVAEYPHAEGGAGNGLVGVELFFVAVLGVVGVAVLAVFPGKARGEVCGGRGTPRPGPLPRGEGETRAVSG